MWAVSHCTTDLRFTPRLIRIAESLNKPLIKGFNRRLDQGLVYPYHK